MLVGISGYIGSGKDTVAKMIQLFAAYHNPLSQDKRTIDSWKDRGDIIAVKEWMKPVYKDTFLQYSTWKNKKFAGKLKQIVSLLTGISVEDLEKQSVKDSELPREWWYWSDYSYTNRVPSDDKTDALLNNKKEGTGIKLWKPTYRQILQELGTNAMRDRVHPNIHVNALFADYRGVYKGLPSEYNWDGNNHLEYPNWVISDLRFPNEAQAIKDRGGICIRINRPINSGSKIIDKIGEFKVKGGLHESETALDNAEFDYIINNSGTLEDLLEQVRTMLLHFKIIEP